MNSAIQCLSNIPQLTEWAKQQNVSKDQKTVTQAYTSLIQSMWSGRHLNISPHIIKQRVSQYAPIFSDFAQKDSHEFMNSLLNALSTEFEGNRSSEEQASIVADLFRIQTESGVTCLHCRTYDSIEETTYCLPLPLGDESDVSLDTLLHDFVKEEPLDGEYYCSNCQELRPAKQKTSLGHSLPPVIIVQLKRFTFDGTNDKLNTFVDYPIVDWKVNDNSLYDLLAISMHFGNLIGGHYTTYARLNASNQWYHFNDSSCEPIDDTDCLVNRNAYVLIYLKKN
jgi:ubiquitin C-terminal hydrolase